MEGPIGGPRGYKHGCEEWGDGERERVRHRASMRERDLRSQQAEHTEGKENTPVSMVKELVEGGGTDGEEVL